MAEWSAANWGNVITAVSLVLAVYFYFKSKRLKKPKYIIRSNNIFSGLEHTIPDIEVMFSGYGNPINALTVTKIAFWNAGNETINKQDVVKENPIRVRPNDELILLSVIIIQHLDLYNKL